MAYGPRIAQVLRLLARHAAAAMGIGMALAFNGVFQRNSPFGTFSGLKTNGFAQGIGREDGPIPGLYAVGTDMASIMGGFHPSGGINRGTAMTFGYRWAACCGLDEARG